MLAILRRRPGPAAALLLLSIACRSSAPEAASEHPATAVRAPPLRLGIIGDQTFSDDLDAAYAVLDRAVEKLTRHHREVAPLDAVVHTGDLVDSAASPAEVASRFAAAAAILDRLPVPWYPAAGDHDVNPPSYRPGSTDRSRRELFRRLLADRVPADEGALHYALDLGPHRLIVLDGQQVAHADPRWGNTFLARIDDRQLAWLTGVLEAGARPPEGAVVVVVHQPHWLAWSGWQRVHELLRRHPVALVVAGHLHHPQDDGVLDGIRYLTVGATGGVTRSGSRSVGDVDHVTVVEIATHGGLPVATTVLLLPLDGEALALPSRRDMERAQALDAMLGALHGIAERHPLRLDSGRLVADCATGAPARLSLAGVGNPIDLEVMLTITPPPGVVLAGAGFADGYCRGGKTPRPDDAFTCRLAVPGANVRFANPSGVEMADEPPLWEAGLAVRQGSGADLLAEGLTFGLRLTWELDERPSDATMREPLRLEREIELEVAPCP